ncbi:MAG: translation elongation factor-like protein [Gemmatimonadetes bacterium]|nr:translation elongation factor-like protein [Gemmatimonadota bacterium]
MAEALIGKITHYFSRAGVAVLSLDTPLRKGEWIRIRGHTTDLRQHVESMEIHHRQIEEAKPGDDVAIQVSDRVRVGDSVYREEPGGGS